MQRSHRTLEPWVAASLVLAAPLPAAALSGEPGNIAPVGRAVTAQRIVPPRVSAAIPVTATSVPWGAADRAVEPVDLAARGYIEEEYFISGEARVLAWPAVGRLTALARGPYVTRLLVRRPARARRFSGTVVVEPLNPSLRHDLPIMWGAVYPTYLRHGDVWIGVTVKPVAIESLKQFDPVRYAALGFPNPLSGSQTCDQSRLPLPRGGLPAESTPQTENGLIWDVLSQVGALAKQRDRTGPLRGLKVSRLYMTGYSQSGAFVLTYAAAIHPTALGGNGKPLYDGFLAATATRPSTPIHQCAAPIPAGDPRQTPGPIGVPLMVMVSESEIRTLRRRPDSDRKPDLFRGYEVAGSSHIHAGGDAGKPAPVDAAKTSGARFGSSDDCAERAMPGNDVPLPALLRGAFRNLDRWSRSGIAPPRGQRIAVRDPSQDGAAVALDRFGNALGGVRTPHVDVPLARYRHRMTGPGICELWGYRQSFTRAELDAIYGTPQAWLHQVRASIRRTVARRWIEPADGQELADQAAATMRQLMALPSPGQAAIPDPSITAPRQNSSRGNFASDGPA
ncbi:alpha/beta hydrolase domain-containing protein [Novosphingobium piscinae]|uniref:alpha/beta hydrolase domain-containing protein n=1 Tax=Novosphingobium piscinae TaxID=1507448 RepID=UPI0016398D72